MCDIISLQDMTPHLVVEDDGCVHVLSVVSIRQIASGQASIAEFDSPELMARALAIALIERL